MTHPLQIVVSGAAGGMGLRLCEQLVREGHRVRGLVLPGDRQAGRLQALGCELREGDLSDPESLRGLCDGADVVYHLAAVILSPDPAVFTRVNRDGTAHLLREADAAEVAHFIYVSSASVVYPIRTPYAESKLQAEQRVAARRGAYTIVRPTLVYDERGGLELDLFLSYLQRFPVVPFIGAGRARKRPVWSHDVVRGLASMAGQPVTHGKTYNLSGGESISMRELAELLLEYRATPRPIVPLPVALFRAAAQLLAATQTAPQLTHAAIAGVVNDADLHPGLMMQELGYRPIGVHEGFERCFGRSRARGSQWEREGIES